MNYEPLERAASAPAAEVERSAPAGRARNQPDVAPTRATNQPDPPVKRASGKRAECRLAVERAAQVQSFEDPVFTEPGQITAMRKYAWRQRTFQKCMSGNP